MRLEKREDATVDRIRNLFKEMVQNEEAWRLVEDLNHSCAMERFLIRHFDRATFEVASGVTKVAIILPKEQKVIKFSSDEAYHDEATVEYKVYQDAVKENLAFLFPYTELFYTAVSEKTGECKFFYIQDMISFAVCDISPAIEAKYSHQCRTVTDEMVKKVRNGFYHGGVYDRQLNKLWVKMVICLYGKRVAMKLEKFTCKHHINDLHVGNIGFLNNKPILLDFSGYQPNDVMIGVDLSINQMTW